MTINIATSTDIDLLVKLRKEQLIDEGLNPSSNIDEELYDYFNSQLKNNSLFQVLLYDHQHNIMATGAIIYYQFPPSYYNPTGLRGYIANMYTLKDYRKRGFATKILDLLVADAKNKGVHKLFLYASTAGKPVYKKYGFHDVDAYMELDLENKMEG